MRNNISDVLEPMVFKALMYKTAFVALSADKDDSKRPYTPQEFLKDMADHVFAPTRQGRTLTVAQKRMQNALLGSFVMAADIARAGGRKKTPIPCTCTISAGDNLTVLLSISFPGKGN